MLVGVLATGVSAFPDNTFDTANDEGQYDYFYKYDFDSIAAGTKLTTFYQSSPASANPLGFNMSAGSVGNLEGTVMEKYDSKNLRDGNYFRMEYNSTKTSGWHGVRLEMTKNGKSYTIGNTLEAEFDVRWEGVADTSMINYNQALAFVSFRRTWNMPHRMLYAKVVAGEEVVGGVTVSVPDKYLRIYTIDGKDVVKLDKANGDFTNFRVIFRDATQTFDVYVDGVLIVEGRSGVTAKDGKYNANYLNNENFVTTEWDYDGLAISREENAKQTDGKTASDRLSFTFFRADYSSSAHTPYIIGVDNLTVREHEVAPSRTAYYENTFEGAVNLLAEASFSSSTGYRFVGSSNIKVESETRDGKTNKFLSFAEGSRLNINDIYQIAQNGNWTVEFDMRATSAADPIQLFRIYDGTNTPVLLSLNKDGTIKFGSNTAVVPDVKMASADSNEWTHIAISMNVDPSDNKGKVDDWNSKNGTASLKYRMSLWVNGTFVGTAVMNRTEIFFESSASSGRTIIDTYYKREALTEAPDLSGFTLARTLESSQTKVVKEYIDKATDTLYRIEYDGQGNFVAGALDDSAKTSTGSVKLTKTGTTHGDLWGFFHNSSEGKAGVRGAIDNIKIYEGVIPSEFAVGENATSGVVNRIDFGAMAIGSESAEASQNANNGGTGVVRFNGWGTSYATKKTDDKVGSYITIADASDGEKFYDVFTPNVAGKVFMTSLTLKNYTSAKTCTFFGVRRQHAGGAALSTPLFRVNNSGNPGFTIGDKTYFLLDKNGDMIKLTKDEWVTISVLVDETGDTPLVSYLVNGEPVYAKGNSFPYPILATNLKGVIQKDTTHIGAIDQRVRIFQGSGSISVDLKEFKTELVENTLPMWEDEVALDFSKLESIDDLGPQFYRTAGVTLENGVLNVPDGETFAWIDYNGIIAKFGAEASSSRKGFNFEMVYKHTCANNNVIMLMVDSKTCQMGYMDTATNNLLGSGNHVTKAHINRLDEEGFSSFSGTMYTNTDMAYFLGGQLISKASNTGSLPTESTNFTAVRFVANSEYKEIYVHNGIKRTLAEKTGDVFKVDPDTFSAASNDRYPAGNLFTVGPFNKHSSTGKVVVKTDENDGQTYYSWSYPEKNTGHFFADVYLNDYTEDKATVFEYDIRFIPSENAAADDASTELVVLRRADSNASDTALFETVLSLTSFGNLNGISGVLYDAEGNKITLSQTEFQKVAAIYDSDAGQVSYRVGGKVPYYKNANGDLILADKMQLKTPRFYRMDAYETRARVVSFVKNITGTLELKEFNIYTINDSASLDFVGLQKATEGNDIRIVAGLDMLYYGSVGFDVVAYGADGEPFSSGKSYETTKVFSSITETVDGVERTVYAKDYGYRYFVTANITDITDKENVTLEVTPYTVVNGEKLNGGAAIIAVDFTNGVGGTATTDYKNVKLEGDNLKANFAATDYVNYTNDGALEFNGLDAQLAFNAYCEGEVSINIANAFGEAATASKFDIYVDGELAKSVELGFGHHTLVLAEGLDKDEHSFKIVKKSGGDFVCVNYVSLCGELTEPTRLERQGAVNVVVYDAYGIQELGNVEVYVQTSEASGNYFIKYNFTYDRTTTNDYDYTNGKADSQYNQKLYRIKGADLVKRVGVNTYEKVFGVLSTGEISLAIKEKWQGTYAKDFIGGFHGDENLVSVDFYLDGKKIDTSRSGVYLGGSNFEMIQNTVINRCDTEETDVMNHNQKYFVNTNGVKHEQQVEFLVDDFQPAGANTFLQMATVYRVNNNGVSSADINKDENLVGAYVNLLDANGKENYSFDLTADEYHYDTSLAGTTNINLGASDKNRYIEYLGNPGGNYEGLYGLVGFVIDDASVKVDDARLAVRLKSGDNKWYASFDTYKGEIVPLGEVWNVSNSFFLDYNPALYGNAAVAGN